MVETMQNLTGKIVRSKQGMPIGVIKKSLIDDKTGSITSLLIDPTTHINSEEYKVNENGEIILPYHCVSPVKDALIFEEINDF